jgi:hypothetical protein
VPSQAPTRLQDQRAALLAFRAAAYEAQIQALRVALAEMNLAEPDSSVPALTTTENALAFAARRLVRATDDLPPERRPRNWGNEA